LRHKVAEKKRLLKRSRHRISGVIEHSETAKGDLSLTDLFRVENGKKKREMRRTDAC